MKNKETLLAIIFGLITILAWIFPAIEIKIKILILILAFLSVGLIYFKEKLSYFFRNNWQEILSFVLILIFLIIFYTVIL